MKGIDNKIECNDHFVCFFEFFFPLPALACLLAGFVSFVFIFPSLRKLYNSSYVFQTTFIEHILILFTKTGFELHRTINPYKAILFLTISYLLSKLVQDSSY